MVFEILSYPMILLTFLSLLHSWSEGYFNFERDKMVLMTPLFNVCFLTSVWVILSFGILYFIDKSEKFPSVIPDQEDFVRLVSILIPSILLFTTYLSFRNEIAFYWDQLYVSSVVKMTGSWNKYYTDFFISDLKHFKTLWIINYSMLFFSLLSLLNIHKLKERLLGLVTLFFNLAVISLFLTLGLYVLGGTPHALSQNSLSANLHHSFFNLWIRYISFGFLALILFISHQYIKQDFLRRQFRMEFDFLFFVSVLTVSSSELIKWMNVAESAESYKLGLSILWGVYSLVLISLGIWKKKKYLRIGAIALFAVTLIKLFFYDLSSLDTISKTIVFVSLGVLLLIISFIYNKFKNIISE